MPTNPKGPAGPPIPFRSPAALQVLDALCATGFDNPGLARLLVETVLALLPIDRCQIELETALGTWITAIGRRGLGVTDLNEHTNKSNEPPVSAGDMARPIAHQGREQGRLRFTPADTLNQRDEGTLVTLLARFGFLFAQRAALERAQEESIRDELTGLYNRRYLRRILERAVSSAGNHRGPVSLLLLDIDHFKRINDEWGHAMGDRVLRLLSELMCSVFRANDVVCRFGGEEFAVLLCDHRSPKSAAVPTDLLYFAERLRRRASELRLVADDGKALLQLTISGGLASCPRDATSVDGLLARADEALYHAKREGRNRICLAGQGKRSPAA